MKQKIFVCVLALALLFGLWGAAGAVMKGNENKSAGNEAVTELQLVMVRDALYYNTFTESTVEGRCGVMDGEISSAVAPGEILTENDQSNFGTGFEYQYGFEPDSVELVIDGKFIVFRALYPENRFGITMEASHVTPTSMTVTCTRPDVLPVWEVTTGSPYRLDVLADGTWREYRRSDGIMVDVAWTMEAWLIEPDKTYQWEVDWQWLYGELPAGTYRFSKNFNAMAYPTADPDRETFDVFAEFTIA